MEVVNVVEARKQFAELMARVAYSDERVIIERRGKPMMAWISMDDLHRLEERSADSERITRRRAALAQAVLTRQAISRERGGQPLPDSAELIGQLREARIDELSDLR